MHAYWEQFDHSEIMSMQGIDDEDFDEDRDERLGQEDQEKIEYTNPLEDWI
mgnify:CR=1 FL=1